MADTANLGLPLLAPSQAQKHVTVNEALARLDALAKGVLVSRTVATPPEAAADGAVWAVPSGAQDDWAGQEGRLAIASGGGWSFVAPREGWRAYALDEGAALRHDGSRWAPDAPSGPVAAGASGAATAIEVIEVDHAVGSGPISETGEVIPRASIVLGVTARVVEEITGTLATWRLGSPMASDRFGTGLGTEAGSYAEGVLSTPTAYWTRRSLKMSAEGGGEFAGGRVRFAIHCIRLTVPDA